MSRKGRILRISVAMVGLFLMVFSVLGTVTPLRAEQALAVSPNVAGQGIGPYAKVTARVATVWAGPGRGFWSIGVLRRGVLVPLTGVSADGLWAQVTTDFGSGWVWSNDVTTNDGVPVVNPGAFAIITSGGASIHSQPGIDAAVISIIGRNSAVFILGSSADGAWIKVRFRYGTGWLRTSLVSLSNGVGATMGAPVAIVNAGSLNVRTGPLMLFPSIGSVPGGTTMPIIGRSHDGIWLQVRSPLGVGWVNIIHVITRNYFGSVPITEP